MPNRVSAPGVNFVYAWSAWPRASWTAARNCSSLKGLMKKATGPMAMAVARAAKSSRAVMTITRVFGESAQRRAKTSKPVTFSIQMSSTTTGTCCFATWARKSSALLNACTANPSDASRYCIDLRTDGSSSTKQTSADSLELFMRLAFRVNASGRQAKEETCTTIANIFGGDRTIVRLDDGTHDRQTHPHSLLFGGKEMIEHFLRVIGGKTGAKVAH